MHLFLTSSPCNDDVPSGVALPCIFFERNGFVDRLRERDLLVVLISHDLAFVREHADRVVLLESGRVVASGTPAAVFDSDAFKTAFPVQAGKEVASWT